MKYRLNVIDSLKGSPLQILNNVAIINLNACITRYDNNDKVISSILSSNTDKVNLCNLASLSFKLGLPYTSYDIINLVDNIIKKVKKERPSVKFIQSNFNNLGETDCAPISELVQVSHTSGIININGIIKKYLNIFGFTDSQFEQVFTSRIDLKEILPTDILNKLPLKSTETMDMYNLLKGLFE